MAVEPITREEMYLAKAGGAGNDIPKPITRREMFLAKAAGEDVATPTPITREEMFLSKISSGTGGGGGAEVKTCNVTFKGSAWMSANRSEISFLAYTALVNGKIENVVLGKYAWGVSDPVVTLAPGDSYVLENVVCGTQMSFVLNDFGNGNDVTFDENFIQNVNDDYTYGIWLISSDATDFDLEVSSFM